MVVFGKINNKHCDGGDSGSTVCTGVNNAVFGEILKVYLTVKDSTFRILKKTTPEHDLPFSLRISGLGLRVS